MPYRVGRFWAAFVGHSSVCWLVMAWVGSGCKAVLPLGWVLCGCIPAVVAATGDVVGGFSCGGGDLA
jgi:hypothetical protein